MDAPSAIIVLDVGKSNAKLALVDRATLAVSDLRTTPNIVQSGIPYPHFDVEALWQWFMKGLAEFAAKARIGAISIATHGACFALLSRDRLALPILDYEHSGPEEINADYRQKRGDFSETYSPDLPNGLNAGRQLFWLSRTFRDKFATVDTILPLPQYWVWRLTGEKSAELTSLGCHTDLWAPLAARYSMLAVEEGWDALFPPLAKAWDVAGMLLPSVARRTGVPLDCRVVVGIHDSNASLLPHLLTRQAPFGVLSTGTWAVVLAPGGAFDRLDPARDCLANIDAFSRPVPSARFMAGREFEIVAGEETEPGEGDLSRIVSRGVMALPTFAPGTGPFGQGRGRWTEDPRLLSKGERAAVAALYTALNAEVCLSLAGAKGDVIVEGPLARNRLFLQILARRIARPVFAQTDATGTIEGAALLALGPQSKPARDEERAVKPLDLDVSAYAEQWQRLSAMR